MDDTIESFLKKMSQDLRSGVLKDFSEEEISRLLKQAGKMDEKRLKILRDLAIRNCEIALAFRQGHLAARKAIESGRASRKSSIYSAEGNSQQIGTTSSSLRMNL